MSGFKPAKKLTISKNQEAYIRANYNRMSIKEMADNLKLKPSKVRRNMEFLKLIQVRRAAVATKVVEPSFNKRFFSVDYYSRQTATI